MSQEKWRHLSSNWDQSIGIKKIILDIQLMVTWLKNTKESVNSTFNLIRKWLRKRKSNMFLKKTKVMMRITFTRLLLNSIMKIPSHQSITTEIVCNIITVKQTFKKRKLSKKILKCLIKLYLIILIHIHNNQNFKTQI